MLGSIAHMRGARHDVTLTGFKWIVKAGLALEREIGGRFVFGYEEALGYTVGSVVRDKDGMSAALLFLDLVADLGDAGQTVMDRLHDLWRHHGLWVSGQTSITRTGPEGVAELETAVAGLGDDPPARVGDVVVTEVIDYRRDPDLRPAWLGEQTLIELRLGERGRVLVRPSGTEPKLKIYVDLREEAGDDLEKQYLTLQEKTAELGATLGAALGI